MTRYDLFYRTLIQLWSKASDIMSEIEQIGKIVSFHRRKSGLSRNQLATFAGVGKTAIFELEKGKMSIRINTLIKILNILNIKIELSSPLMAEFNRNRENSK